MHSEIRYAVNRPDVLEELIGDELVIINFRTGKYHGIRGSGVVVWQLLDSGYSVDEVVAHFSRRCSDLDATATGQIANFVVELEQQELLTRAAGRQASPNALGAIDAALVFGKPELETRDDLQDHLMLDPIHDVDEHGWPSPKH